MMKGFEHPVCLTQTPLCKRGMSKDIHPHPFPPPSKGEDEGGGKRVSGECLP